MSRSRPRHPMYDALLDAGRAELPDDDRVEQIYQRTAAAVAVATVATATTAAAVSTATTSTAVATGATAPTATGLATGASAVGTGATTVTVGSATGGVATATLATTTLATTTLGTATWAKITLSGVLLAAAATAITVPLVSEERDDPIVDGAVGQATDVGPAEPEAEDPSRAVAVSPGEEPEVAPPVTVRVATQADTIAEAADPATVLGVGLLREARQALAVDPLQALELVGEHRRAHPAAMSEERDFIVVRAHVALGETEVAREKAEAFRVRYPNSAYLTQMDSLLSH